MKIKQLEWVDCTPTVSSNVVSRAQALGYTFEVTENIYGDYVMGVSLYINGTPVALDNGFVRQWALDEAAQEAAQEWLEARITEIVEMKAVEIQWDRPFESKYVSKDGLYTIHVAHSLGRFYPEFNHLGVQSILPDLSLSSFGAQGAKSLEEAFSRCQDHKQADFERTLRSFL